MSIALRGILVVFSLLTMLYVLRKIRQSKLEIENSIFWIGFSVLMFLMSVLPKVIYWFSRILGFQSPVNFVFLLIIFILIIKNFMMTLQISQMEYKQKELVQKLALKEIDKREEKIVEQE